MVKLLVTLDVEPDCDIHWNRSNPLKFTSVTVGIPKILRPIWDKYDVKPIYFVSPEVVMDKKCCRYLKQEIKMGAIIGTHLHSEYIAPNITIKNPKGKPSKEIPCFTHDTKTEFEKIKNFTKLIERNLGVKPMWYRAARYGADLDTIKSLKKLGYKYDSSVTPHIDWSKQGGPDHSKAPEQPYWISKSNFYKATGQKQSIGIREYPITIIGKRFGILGKILPNNWYLFSWLRPTHMTVYEQKKLIRNYAKKYKNSEVILMFHSMEIMSGKTPFVRNQTMQKLFLSRLEKIIRFIKHEKL
ncbi:TPA: hypothetical protein HA235_02505 [Candidatus Woesearchaeota archaeon]|nr:hypothetical protein [Candidatus Woesearchaeota archaeon]HIH31556.1 hypothetical protein [Candidatus Woesearchaeota archaeon]HIH54286.1 hypothetical protein [Candidatus Woesearchaeota archaeon]HIJ02524.1 hypothetical protein [Candidatus Woesearchaeota archaeon]HIJ13430.1 hypothetical protein [Candidatus Woesearchaeota archaeon]